MRVTGCTMKILSNFYIEEKEKKAAEEKLERLCGRQTKGQFSSFLRVMVKQFLATPDEKVNPLLIEAIEAEYVYSQTLNKRSKM